MKASDREWIVSCQVEELEVSVWMSESGRKNSKAQIPRVPAPICPVLPSGDQSAVEPPGPIPNPEVKRRSANGSETIGLVRVGRRQVYARLQAIGAGLFFAPSSPPLPINRQEPLPKRSATMGWQ